MNSIFKSRRTRRRNLLLVLMPFLVTISVFGFIIYKSATGLVGNVSGAADASVFKYSIDSMDYHLRNNATDLQVDLFKELTDLINDENAEDKEIAKLVVGNFVADFYTWTNKSGTYDVGGMYYVYSPQKINIYNQARNTFYKYLTYYINTMGSENLLEVTAVNLKVGDTTEEVEINGRIYDSFSVTARLEYKNEDMFNGIDLVVDGQKVDLVKKIYFNVIKNDDGRFEIVRGFGDY